MLGRRAGLRGTDFLPNEVIGPAAPPFPEACTPAESITRLYLRGRVPGCSPSCLGNSPRQGRGGADVGSAGLLTSGQGSRDRSWAGAKGRTGGAEQGLSGPVRGPSGPVAVEASLSAQAVVWGPLPRKCKYLPKGFGLWFRNDRAPVSQTNIKLWTYISFSHIVKGSYKYPGKAEKSQIFTTLFLRQSIFRAARSR